MSIIEKNHLPVECLTPDSSKNYFFGYFDKFAEDISGRYYLAARADFWGRQPTSSDMLELGVIDSYNDMKFSPFATTTAWCWQQGCMLQWLPNQPNSVIYNVREAGAFVAKIENLKTGEKRTLPRPIYTVAPNGEFALSLNFSLLDRERPGYGYTGLTAELPMEADGIWRTELATGETKLLLSIAELKERYYRDSMNNTPNWVNHLLCSPDSREFVFVHRWRTWQADGSPTHLTHLITADATTGESYPLNLEDMSSHFVWQNNRQIVAFANQFKSGWQYYIFNNKSRKVDIVAKDIFPGDGHCSDSPDGRWMLTDSYPLDDICRKLFLYEYATGRAIEIGSFRSENSNPIPTRCDLHPRWSRDGKSVSIDSIHQGRRAIYRINIDL